MVSIFRSYHPAIIFLLLLYTFLFRLILIIHPETFVPPVGSNVITTFLFDSLNHFISNRIWIYHVIAALLVFFQALYFNYIVNYYRILSRPSYLPAFSYILISSLFIEFLYLTPALIGICWLLPALSKIFSSYKKDNVLGTFFDAAFYVSIASIFFFPYIAFLLFIIVSIAILRPFNLREYLIALLGVVLPYYFLGVYFFWENRLPEFLKSVTITELHFNTQVMEKSARVITAGIPVLLVMAWSAFFIQNNLFKMVVQVRNYLIVFSIFFFAGIFSLLIQFNGTLDHFVWLTIPAGIAFALFFAEYKRRYFSEIVHLFLILAILFFQYFDILKGK